MRAAWRCVRHSIAAPKVAALSAMELKEIVVGCAKAREMPAELWKGAERL